MKVSATRLGGELTIFLYGELDHHAARTVIPKIGQVIDTELAVKVKLDFSGITFMDSSGIALAIGAYKHAVSLSGVFSICNVSDHAYRIFEAAGICKLLNISKREKVSV